MLAICKRKRITYLLVSVLVFTLLLGGSSVQAQSDPTTDPFPVLDYGQGSKAIIIRFDFNADGSVVPSSVQVVYSYPRLRQGGPPVLLVQLYNDDGEMVEEYFDWDPRTLHNFRPVHSTEYVESASGVFVSPFKPDLNHLEIRDAATNDVLAVADLVPGIQFFCQQNPNDPDCMADLSVSKSNSPDPVAAGDTLEYTLVVENNGSKPAQLAQVVDTLPSGVTYVSDTGGCVEEPVGTLTCDLGRVGAGDTVQFTVTVHVDADLVYNAGGPTTITNNGTVTDLAGTDTDPSNNSDSEDTEVIALADVAVTGLEVLEPPFELIIDTDFDVTLRTTVTNYGPSAPIDTHVTRAASGSTGASVVPPLIESDEAALGLNELRVIEDVFTIRCTTPGPKTFTFTSDIALAHPEDTDPDLSNNHAEYDLVVECVIPVEIDIKPGNAHNPINLGSNGVFQVVIFTNPDYVQYLEATDIDPSTIDFAGAGAQVLGNGRYWTQERDVNRDGYTDLIVHIQTEEIVLEELVPPEELLQIEDCTDVGAVLRAATFNDIHVRGEDCITRVPPNQ